MRTLAPLALAALLCHHPALAEEHGKVIDETFHSAALGVDKHVVVWLPARYATSRRRYPVIYLLHGLGGNETNFVRWAHVDRIADAQHLQAILVMPDGDDGFYVNWARPAHYARCLKRGRPFGFTLDRHTYCVKRGRYEDYIVHDLLHFIDGKYRTIADRRGRGIGGISMGGYGALDLAFRHPDLFSAVASHSGVDALLYAGPHPYARGKVRLVTPAEIPRWGAQVEPIGGWVRGLFGPDYANWKAHDPATLATHLKEGELAIYLDCGTEDDFGLDAEAAYLDRILTARGIEHTFFLGPGHHAIAFWSKRLPKSIAFFARALHAR